MSHPLDPPPGQAGWVGYPPPHAYPIAHPQPPPGWAPAWAPQPPARRRLPVAATVGIVLGVAALLLVVVLGLDAGRTAAGDLRDLATSLPAPTTTPPADPAGLGNDEGLDTYAQRCHGGEMDACDDLYHLSEVLSDYEHYGLTCGGRIKPLDVARCTDLG